MGPNDDQISVVLYGPTLDALGGGEVWIERIANEMAARDIPVAALGHRHPFARRVPQWNPNVIRDFVNSDEVSMPAAVPARKAFALATVERLTGGWRPTGWYERRLAGDEMHQLRTLLDRTPDAVVICTDLYTSLALDKLRTEDAVSNRYVSVHHNTFGALSRGSLRALRRTTRTSSALVALTADDAEKFRAAGFPTVRHIPNPAAQAETGHEPPTEAKAVAWVGRMSPEKDLPTLLRAWGHVSAAASDWRLELYGDGELRPELERLADTLGLGRSVKFMGTIPNSAVAFRKVAINVLTSRLEGWPLVIGEAAAFGVPTVAIDCAPGVREQVRTGETGVLVEARDPKAVADALLALITDQGARQQCGERAKTELEGYEVSRIVDRWLRLATEVQAQHA